MAQTVQTVSGSANLEFSMNLYAPIFSSDPSNINFAVQSKGSFTITPNVQISQFAINFALSPQGKRFSRQISKKKFHTKTKEK